VFVKYSDIDLRFSLEGANFTVLNLVYEQFHRSIPKHSHSQYSYEIHYISRGYGYAVIDNVRYRLTPGTVYITGPGIEHEQFPSEPDPMEEYCIYLRLDRTAKPAANAQLIPHFLATPFWFGEASAQLAAVIERIFYEMREKPLGYKSAVAVCLQQVLIALVRGYHMVSQPTDVPFDAANLFDQKYLIIEECFLYEYPTLTLTALADRLGLSTRQTERMLKEHYGKTFLQKRNEARMSAAAVELTTTDKSIGRIAEDLGYSAAEHFSNTFRRFYGVSAREYRRRNQSIQEIL